MNCYRDQAVTNAAQLADLLSSADVPVVPPQAYQKAGVAQILQPMLAEIPHS